MAIGEAVGDGGGIGGAVEDEQPPVAACQLSAHGLASRVGVEIGGAREKVAGKLAAIGEERAFVFRAQPPDQRVFSAMTVGVFQSDLRFADAGHADEGLRVGERFGGAKRGVELGENLVASREMNASTQRHMPQRAGLREYQLLSPGRCRGGIHFDGDEVRRIGHWGLHVHCGNNGSTGIIDGCVYPTSFG